MQLSDSLIGLKATSETQPGSRHDNLEEVLKDLWSEGKQAKKRVIDSNSNMDSSRGSANPRPVQVIEVDSGSRYTVNYSILMSMVYSTGGNVLSTRIASEGGFGI